MARSRGTPEGNGKIKFRFVEFEMDAASASLEEGLKSIAAALTRGVSPTGATRVIREVSDQTLPSASQGSSPAEDAEEEDTSPRSAPRKQVGPRKIATRKILEDFKLDTVKPTLKEFATLKNPKSDLKKYLVIAFWAKNHMKMDELSPDHFFTAYRALGWSTPKDLTQPIRNLVNPSSGKFSASSVPGHGKINHIGEQAVLDMSS